MNNFKLIEKNIIADNIFELIYEPEDTFSIQPGQFITFILPQIGGRAYSILDIIDDKIVLIIKRWSKEMWGRWWSMVLCDAEVWDSFQWVWPAGHFVLNQTDNNKLFIWTGTWFVPLYNQILAALQLWLKSQIKLLFWIRHITDVFYEDQLKTLKSNYSNFDYEIFLSKDDTNGYSKWYVTDYLCDKTVWFYKEYYICGAPAMIDSVNEILSSLNVSDEQIFSEKF